MDAVKGLVPAQDLTPSVSKSVLRIAARDLSDRGLYAAARWAAELLNAIPSPTADGDAFQTSTPRKAAAAPVNLTFSSPGHDAMRTVSPKSGYTALIQGVKPSALDAQEHDQWALGKAYFDAKELERASRALKECKGPRGRFLYLYTRYLAAEKKVQEEPDVMMGPKDKLRPFNPELIVLHDEIGDTNDPYELYLKGILYSKMGKRLQAVESLLRAGQACPYNWSCWLKLATIIERQDELDVVTKRLPQSFMSRIFGIHAVLEIHAATEILSEAIKELIEHFPTSLHLKAQQALIAYHLREFDEAERFFDEIFDADPYRVDDIDTYSNILYVMEKRAKLASMAQKYIALDRYRPETCCLIGNYYSLRGEHEKAVLYFRRALKLDRGYLSAWTLMGHEYVEMKNTHAAVEAYRRAIDVNRKDYRAWYGLGQTYELLDMHFYALSYYQHATALRPYDTRMWTALGGCYERLKNVPEAVKAFKRALLSAEPGEINLIYRLAALAQEQGQLEDVAAYHRHVIVMAPKEEVPLSDYAKSYIVLARLEIERGHLKGNLDLAEEYLVKIKDSTLNEKEEATELLNRLRPLQSLKLVS